MKIQFSIRASDEESLVASCYNAARSFFGEDATIAILLEVAYAQEVIVVPDPAVPIVVDWAATVTAQPLTSIEQLMTGWTLVP